MTKFESIKSKNIDEFAEWLDKHGQYEGSAWCEWFDKNYCQKCEMITISRKEYARIVGWNCSDYYGDIECGYCEVHKKCRFFEDMDKVPDNTEIIKMWLETEAKDEASI